MDETLDLLMVNYLLKGLSDELLKANDPDLNGMTLEEIEKSEKYGDLVKALIGGARTKPQNGIKMRGGGAKGKNGLVWKEQQVTRNGKTFTQGFWVRAGDDQKYVNHTKYNADTGKREKMTGSGREEGLQQVYKDAETGNYTEKRVKLHNDIVNRFLDKCKKPENGEAPTLLILGGGSASGKSSGLKFASKKANINLDNFGTVDCDAVMKELPEFESLKRTNVNTNANMAHYEASDITKLMMDGAIEHGGNFIWDGTLSKVDKTTKIIEKAKKKGFKIVIVNMSCDDDEAVKRNLSRAQIEGREVPLKMVMSTHKKNAETFDKVKDLADDYYLFDTNPNPDGSWKTTPDLIESKADGLLNEEQKKRFTDKQNIDVNERAKEMKPVRDAQMTKQARRKAKAEKKQKDHDKALENRRKEMRAKAEKNLGKSEPMMSLEDFWKSMDYPQDIDDILKSMAGEELEKSEGLGFFAEFGIDKDNLLDHREYPKKDLLEKIRNGKEPEEKEEE